MSARCDKCVSVWTLLGSISLMFSSIIQGLASPFLGRLPTQGRSQMLEHSVLAELELMFGSEHRKFTEKRLGRIEQDLQPMMMALPKNQYGNLDHSAANYALHRLFVQRHGWFLLDLVPDGEANALWNSSSPAGVLPEHVDGLFEKLFNTSGSGLRELAVLAATLEHMVHKEAMIRLEVAFHFHGWGKESDLTEDEALEVLDTYMAIYILGTTLSIVHDPLNDTLHDVSTISIEQVHELRASIPELYPNWPATQEFLREVHKSLSSRRDYFFFADVARAVEEVGERYGRWQDAECHNMKKRLVAKEDPSAEGSGRVLLGDFYTDFAKDQSLVDFSESPVYLRQLGALDESDSTNPRLIIPNYINSPANCLASSSYYSVCCINECGGLLSDIERKLGKSEAAPEELAAIVAGLPSATVLGGRVLSTSLMARLSEVAGYHGGAVPLHGRLFAQWMHYAYPRECPYPHVSGSTSPFNFSVEPTSDQDSLAVTVEEAHSYIAQATAQRKVRNDEVGAEEHTMWTMDEELVVCRTAVPDQPLSTGMFGVARLRGLGLVAGMATISAGIARSFVPMGSKSRPGNFAFDRHYV